MVGKCHANVWQGLTRRTLPENAHAASLNFRVAHSWLAMNELQQQGQDTSAAHYSKRIPRGGRVLLSIPVSLIDISDVANFRWEEHPAGRLTKWRE